MTQFTFKDILIKVIVFVIVFLFFMLFNYFFGSPLYCAGAALEEDEYNSTFTQYIRKFLPEDYADGLALRDTFHHFGEIGQFEDLISRHNLIGVLGYVLYIVLLINMFSVLIHFFIWKYSSYFITNFPKSIGRYVQSKIFYLVVTLDLILIGVDIITILRVITFMCYDVIPMYVGVAADIQLGTTALPL